MQRDSTMRQSYFLKDQTAASESNRLGAPLNRRQATVFGFLNHKAVGRELAFWVTKACHTGICIGVVRTDNSVAL
jgi:hypothetical protein